VKALVFHGLGQIAWEDRPEPELQEATDAIVTITHTTICGTDLHILKGDVPEVTAGRVLGHEGVGIVTETGSGVTRFKVGDKVLISCITSCGKCAPCRKGMYSHCENGGWILGRLVDGTQAEHVRIPHADTSLYHVPKHADDEALVMFSDVFPTSFECGVLNGRIKPGDTVAIIGAGPVGLACLLTAQFFSPAEIIMVDPDMNRLEIARGLGATMLVQNGECNAADEIMRLTGGKGVDVAIEAVGLPESFNTCQGIVAIGGHIANVGAHGVSVELYLEKLWSRNIVMTTGLVDTVSITLLLEMIQSGKLRPEQLITHHFALSDILLAYDTFKHAAREKALKVILTNPQSEQTL
jgi:alcohol dehydrogenase